MSPDWQLESDTIGNHGDIYSSVHKIFHGLLFYFYWEIQCNCMHIMDVSLLTILAILILFGYVD